MIVGLLLLGVGGWMVYLSLTGRAYSKRMGVLAGGYFAVFGAAVCITLLFTEGRALLWTMTLGLGGLLGGVGVWNMAKPFCCRRRMDGVYQGSAHVHRGWYSPVFAYRVDERSFSPTEGYTYRERTLARRFAVGEAYPIWVNEKRPAFFVSQKKVRCPDVLLLLFGIGVLLLPFYV